MAEEIYKNGDIYYIKTLLGEIKMFDKDDNEISWTPTQNLGDKVIFYNQAYINEQTKRLEQENKELKALNKKICEDWEKAIKVYWNALEEIRILATKNVSFENFVKIQNKINKVLNDN